MKNEQDISETDILLASYFAGEANAAEKEAVEKWLSASEENRNYFEQSKKTWNASGDLLAEKTFNTDAAWNKLQNRMHEKPAEQKPVKRNYYWAAAAAIVLLIGITALFMLTKDSGTETQSMQFASTNEILNSTLPDGSKISLNKNSQIDYPAAFTGEKREVKLSGEAFFDISHDAKHPFIIHTGMMDVKVLGTSFNVRAYPNSDSVHVSVQTGRVQCAANGDTVYITPGEYAVYHKGKGKIRKGTEDDPNRSAYRDRIFRFNKTPLAIAVQQLNEAYGCNIILKNDQLRTCEFSTTKVFKNEPVENIITAIEAIYPGITSKKEGKNIILDGTGCQ